MLGSGRTAWSNAEGQGAAAHAAAPDQEAKGRELGAFGHSAKVRSGAGCSESLNSALG